MRQLRTKPIIDALRPWLEAKLAAVSGKSTIAEAIRYALSRWDGLVRFLDDGRIEIDSNVVERAIRPIALGRKNHLFAGSDGGGEHWAVIASLIETCKMNDVDPEAYLRDVLAKIVARHPMSASTSCCRSPMCGRRRGLRPNNTAYGRSVGETFFSLPHRRADIRLVALTPSWDLFDSRQRFVPLSQASGSRSQGER